MLVLSLILIFPQLCGVPTVGPSWLEINGNQTTEVWSLPGRFIPPTPRPRKRWCLDALGGAFGGSFWGWWIHGHTSYGVKPLKQDLRYTPPKKLTFTPEQWWFEDDPASFWGLVGLFWGAFLLLVLGMSIQILHKWGGYVGRTLWESRNILEHGYDWRANMRAVIKARLVWLYRGFYCPVI